MTELAMSMFATKADYWKARAEEAENAVKGAALAERERIKAVLLKHEPLAGAYVHDLIRAIDNDDR